MHTIQYIMDFSHNIMHTIQHIIKCEQDIMTMMNQMFLFLTIRQLWRSIKVSASIPHDWRGSQEILIYCVNSYLLVTERNSESPINARKVFLWKTITFAESI